MRLITTMFSLLLMTTVLWTRSAEKHEVQTRDVTSLNISGALQVAWSADSSLFAVLTGPNIEIWDAERWQLRHTIRDVYAYHIKWHPDRNYIAALSARNEQDEVDEVLSIWDGETGDLRQSIINIVTEDIVGIVTPGVFAWNPVGTHLVSTSVMAMFLLWTPETSSSFSLTQIRPTYMYGIIDIDWSPDGEHLLSGGSDGRLRVWKAQTGEEILSVPGYKFVDWHPDGKLFAGAGFDTLVSIWNVETAALERQFSQHQRAIAAVEWHPDGRFIASADADGKMFIWDTQNELNYTEMVGLNVRNFSWKPDGSQIAIIELDGIHVVEWP
jgi:WD40 repeat protein